jgi:hypothetical protein
MSTFDNIRHLIGNNQILGKKDWVFGFGECKIVLDSQKIRDIYIFKASKILINKMLNGSIPKDTAYTIANKWIDKPEVNIRENKENVMNFIPNQNESDNDTIVSNRITQVKHELIKLIKHLINDEGGIPNAIHVLQAIDFLINNFSNNMETELHEAEEGNPNRLKSQVTFMEEDLEKYQRKFFKSSSKIKEIENRIMNLSENANKLENRIYKIHKACNFFAIIKTTITEEISRIEQIKSKLESIKQEFNSLTIELDNSKNISQNVFNLQNLLTDKMDISDQEISYTDFVASTSDENTIYNWGEDSNENIKKSLSEYLDKYYFKKYGKLDISMAFKTFDESTITEIFERALRIASVPIDYDNLGYYSVIENIIHFLIPRNMDFDLNKIDIKSEPKSPTEILETDDLNRIVIQKNIEILHPFMITSIQNMEIKYGYTSSNKAYFSNAEIATRMENEGYSISPKGKK